MASRTSLIVIGAAVVAAVASPLLQLALGPVSYVAGALAYLLVLTALAVALWIGLRLTRSEIGLRLGSWRFYALALAYPTLVMLAIGAAAAAAGAISISPTLDVRHTAVKLSLMAVSGLLAGFLTEEGFFRGALWGAAVRAGWRPLTIVAVTSLGFLAWHLAVPFVDSGYAVPRAVLPLYFANALLLGAAWGLLRLGSGSVLLTTVVHSIWNGLAYTFFGDGDAKGALGIVNFGLLDPERGWLGLVANLIVVALLARWLWPQLRPPPGG